jgi:hypothetical protein
VHRDATDGAHSRVHDAIQRLIRKATSGIPGRNSGPTSAWLAKIRKPRSRVLLSKVRRTENREMLAQTRKTDHFFRFVFAERFLRKRDARIL